MSNPFPYLLLLFVIAAFFHAEFLLYAVYALLGAVLLARWWARHALKRLTYTRRFESHVFLGDAIPITVEVRNSGKLPCAWVVAREVLPVELAGPLRVAHALALAPGERRAFHYELHGRRRGLYRLGPMRLDSADLLGQEEYRAEGKENDWVTVYPQIVPLERLGLPSLSPFGHLRSRERLYADPSRAGGLRDYAPGDSVRDVHWSASAAAGSLQVKTYEPAMSLPTALLLDMSLACYDRWMGPLATELGVVVAASLAAALGNARQEIALFTNGRDPLTGEEGDVLGPDMAAGATAGGRLEAGAPRASEGRLEAGGPRGTTGGRLEAGAPRGEAAITGLALGKGPGHLVRVLELLARVEAVSEDRPDDLMAAARARLPWGATIVAIGPSGDLAYRGALLALRRSGFNVAHVVLGTRGGASSDSIPTFYVNSVDDLKVWAVSS